MFGRRKVQGEPSVADLLKRLGELESAFRQLETEQIGLHQQVRTWMRRAVAAERRAEQLNQGAGATVQPARTPGQPAAISSPARARAALQGRIWGQSAPVPPTETEEVPNGVHS